MPETFESLLVKFGRASVDYLVVGGVAVCLNGFVQTTQALDLLVDASLQNLDRLLACLANFGEGFARELSPEDFPLEEGAVRVIEDFTVDIFTIMCSRTFQYFSANARHLDVEGVAVRYLGPEALIELKSASTREKDQLDVASLRAIMAGASPTETVDLVDLTPPPGEPPSD